MNHRSPGSARRRRSVLASQLRETIHSLTSENDELRAARAEADRTAAACARLTADFDNVLNSTDVGVILLDANLTVQRITQPAVMQLPALAKAVGGRVDQFAGELGGDAFVEDATQVLRGAPARERQVEARDGRQLLVRLTPYLTKEDHPTGVVINIADVTALVEARGRAQTLLDWMPQRAAIVDRVGTIVMVNAAWRRFAREKEGPADHLRAGGSYCLLCRDEWSTERDRQAAEEALARVWSHGDDHMELEYASTWGPGKWCRLRARRVDIGGALVCHEDVTEWRPRETESDDLAMTDPLTRTLSVRALGDLLLAEADRARRDAAPLAAVHVSCADVSAADATPGMVSDNEVLAQVARRLAQVLRPSDLLGRVGDREFLAILPDTRPIEAARIATRLHQSATQVVVTGGAQPVTLAASMAVCAVDTESPRIEDIVRRARAKRVAHPVGPTRSATESLGETSTTEAWRAAGEALRVFAHPIVHLATGEHVGREFLTRGADGLNSMPEDLFRRAMEDGQLASVDLHCLRSCVTTALRFDGWRHVNLYPSTLVTTPVEQILELFPKGDHTHGFCVELSEQQLAGASTAMRAAAAALRRAGLRLSIDDVGFGRTSLEHLVLLEPEVVKVDRNWVRGIARDRGRERTFGRLMAVAQALRAVVIAEGIEDRDDVAALLHLGAEFGQGFLFGQPSHVAPPS